jgi:hypothetical protein
MSTIRRAVRVACCLLVLALLPTIPAAFAQNSKSGAAAKELGQVLDRLKLDCIAAADPSEQGSFVAALYYPGSTLLVVAARYSAPTLLLDKLAKKEYRDVYIDLNAASVAGSKVFVMDQAADGLVAKPGDGAPDSWEQGNKTTAFDGDWRKAKLSEEEYVKAFADADERYARILSLLAEQAKKSGS